MDIKPIAQKLINETVGKVMPSVQSGAKPFIESLKTSMAEVNQLQKLADHSVTALATGKDQDLHQTMIAVEKADISFQLMMQVRNKILSAYEEISRMQI